MTAALGRALAGVVCILGMPVHLCLCTLIKMCDPGPALHRGRRLGKNGVIFELLKYRTMKVNALPVVTAGFKMVVVPADPRVTRLGRWLRCGIDELPQLYNIVRGEMSWVGPRPDEAWMLPHYGPFSKQRLSLAPGITGLAQVLNSRELSTAEGYSLDLWYTAHCSFWLDAWIVLVTPLFMAGWCTIGCSRLRRLRSSQNLEGLRRRCEAELAGGAAHSAAAADVSAADHCQRWELS